MRRNVFTNGAIVQITAGFPPATYPAPTKMLKRVTLPERRRQPEFMNFDPREPLKRAVFEGMQASHF